MSGFPFRTNKNYSILMISNTFTPTMTFGAQKNCSILQPPPLFHALSNLPINRVKGIMDDPRKMAKAQVWERQQPSLQVLHHHHKGVQLQFEDGHNLFTSHCICPGLKAKKTSQGTAMIHNFIPIQTIGGKNLIVQSVLIYYKQDFC